MIKLSNIAVGYTNALLKNINLSFELGACYALIGENGSGKSTLLKSIVGLIPFLNGECYIAGKSYKNISRKGRSELISYLPGKPNVFSNKKVSYVLSLFTNNTNRLAYWVSKMELQPFLQKTFGELSDGQRQLLLISMQLIKESPYIFLDEPMNHLDVNRKEKVLQVLNDCCKHENKCVVLTIHDRYLIDNYFDKIIQISDLQ